MMMFICINQHLSFEAQLMKMLSNTEVKLNQSVAYKKSLQVIFVFKGSHNFKPLPFVYLIYNENDKNDKGVLGMIM